MTFAEKIKLVFKLISQKWKTRQKTASQQNLELLQAFFRSSSDICILLTENFNLLAFNSVAEEFYYWKSRDILNKNFKKLCASKGYKFLLDNDSFLKLKSIKYLEQTTYLKRSKKKYKIQWGIHYMLDNLSRAPMVLCIGKPIDETLLFNIQDMPGNLYWKDSAGVYLGCTNFLAKTVNLKIEDIIGKTDYELWPQKAQEFRENDRKAMESGQAVLMQESVIYPNNVQQHFTAVKVPLKDASGNTIGVICNSLDITELKHLTEELRQAKESAEIANKAKSEFLAVVSHELRIPLTNILGMTYYLGTEPISFTDEQRAYLDNTIKASNHLLVLVNDLLDFAKIEIGKFELTLAPFDLRLLLEETVLPFTQQAKEKNIELLVNYAPTVPHKIFGDARAIRQILMNLIGNAIKFTEKGYVSIHINWLQQFSEQGIIELVVSDTGIGISEEKLDLIFERFRQADSPTIRKYGGTGLGLSITKALLELMGSDIEVKSVLGQGSSFKCIFNFPLQDNSIIEQPWSVYQSSIRILIIDDSPRGDVLRQQISPTNCQVISSKDALNTFLVFQQGNHPYPIVIIDSNIQEENPIALARKINGTTGLTKPMLILLTSNGTYNQKAQAKEAGFFDCFIKPVQPIEFQTNLTAAWEKWIEQKEILLKQTHQQSLRVLLVEDMPLILMLHKRFLMELNCVVETAEDGQKALEMLKNPEETFDVICMDIGLPDISGEDIIKHFRENRTSDRHIPIIALTAFGTQDYKKKFFELGIDEIMVKPITKQQLSEVLQKYRKHQEGKSTQTFTNNLPNDLSHHNDSSHR